MKCERCHKLPPEEGSPLCAVCEFEDERDKAVAPYKRALTLVTHQLWLRRRTFTERDHAAMNAAYPLTKDIPLWTLNQKGT